MGRLVPHDHKYWCPGPWPWEWFDTCIRHGHAWQYDFDWVHSTGFLLVSDKQGCENGTLYTWQSPGGGVGSSTAYHVTEFFDDKLSSQGTCAVSGAGGYPGSVGSPLIGQPFAPQINNDVLELKSTVAEQGTFEFTGEHATLCQKGSWSWLRTLHDEVSIASVVRATRFISIQWYIGGIPILNNSGNISLSTFCRWPFPLPKGRSENRIVHVRYEIVTGDNKSTLRIFNDPLDGSYSLSIAMSALENGKEFASDYVSSDFHGETCDFEPEKVRELAGVS